ncbi:MAG TPA: hypothetical protein VHD32_13120 [Candidatus Didemnitutus sp.]|nr:hypothetical protein [Candidatus Didemnitutus sp.]
MNQKVGTDVAEIFRKKLGHLQTRNAAWNFVSPATARSKRNIGRGRRPGGPIAIVLGID